MVTPFKVRLYLLVIILLGGFCLLSYRLYEIQINQHHHYSKLVPGNKRESIRIPGIRGEIKDRNGVTIVDSTPNYELQFDLREIVEAYKKDHEEVPKFTYEFVTGGLKRRRTDDDIVEIVETVAFPGLQSLGLLTDYSSKAMRVHYRSNGGVVPFTYHRDLGFKDFARFAERNIGIPGVNVTRTGRRRYLYDSMACHVLGYVALADLDLVPKEKQREYTYYVGDDFGVQGIEKTMDAFLQGKPGRIVIEKNEKRKYIGEVEKKEPQAGSDVLLTIDAKLQYAMEIALRKVGRGAAAAVDPQTGEILAIASVPSFNPNAFIPGISANDWKRYTTDSTSPLHNRAVSPYAPGSTFKIPVSLGGCYSSSWSRHFYCGGGAKYGSKFMKCWHANHGSVDLSNAIKRSCNGFYYRYANDTGIDNINRVTDMMGLGSKTGIRITNEKPGNVPSPEWLRQQGRSWNTSWTALTSIGQGVTEATPLQMACTTAWTANGGKIYQPRIIKAVIDQNGNKVLDEKPVLKYDLTKEGLTAEQVETVKRGMWRVVNEQGGTAGRALSTVTVISGKTGTAQTGVVAEPTNAWFIGFAPYDKPEIAVCVFVQNGKSGGGAASPIARNIIENYMAIQAGKSTLELTQVPEAVGDRTFIEMTEFDEEAAELAALFSEDPEAEADALAADSIESEGAMAVDVSEFVTDIKPKKPQDSSYAEPTIQEEADSRGSVEHYNSQTVDRLLDPTR